MFPLCYNFLNMLKDDDSSEFTEYIGKSVNLAPLLGEGYNRWLPILIFFLALVTLLNLHGRILQIFKIKDVFYHPKMLDPECAEGRSIINHGKFLYFFFILFFFFGSSEY